MGFHGVGRGGTALGGAHGTPGRAALRLWGTPAAGSPGFKGAETPPPPPQVSGGIQLPLPTMFGAKKRVP
jgi:hypothetical protein